MRTSWHLACLCRTWVGTDWSGEDQLSWISSQWNPVHKSQLRAWTQFYRFLFLIKLFSPTMIYFRLSFPKQHFSQGGDKTICCDHIVLQLDVICSPVLGKHHQKCEVKRLLGSPPNTVQEHKCKTLFNLRWNLLWQHLLMPFIEARSVWYPSSKVFHEEFARPG